MLAGAPSTAEGERADQHEFRAMLNHLVKLILQRNATRKAQRAAVEEAVPPDGQLDEAVPNSGPEPEPEPAPGLATPPGSPKQIPEVIRQIKQDLDLEAGLSPKQVIDKVSMDYGLDTSSGTMKDKVKKLADEFGIETGW